MSFRVAHISLPKPGERENGDAVLVRREDEQQRLMLAVVDGLGHGPTAAQAAQAAIRRLEILAMDLPLLEMMRAVHHELSGTIGASATVCAISGHKLEACAVGNVRFASGRSSVPLLPSPGVLGRKVAKFRVCRCELGPRTWLALFSDGISPSARLAEAEMVTPEAACKAFIAQFRKREDDATILFARMDDE